MEGRACGTNGRQRWALETDYGYIVLDIYNGQVCLCDVLSGDLRRHGSVNLRNLTSGTIVECYVAAFDASRQSAESLLSHR
jgi:hypothetical protein